MNRSAREVPVYRLALIVGLTLSLSACAGIRPGKVILTEDTRDRYVQLREGQAGYVLIRSGHIDHRPDLDNLHEVHGDLAFICREINGVDNPGIVIESRNKGHYQVVYPWGDRGALEVIAKPLGLLVTQEEREVQALTIRVAKGGHRLEPAAEGKQVEVEEVCCDIEGRWPLDGVTADELARFLETRYRRPVVNRTALKGRWSILLSEKAGKTWPSGDEKAPLDDLGLELRWEKVKVPVVVVKDKPRD
jgi:hypothetical protein